MRLVTVVHGRPRNSRTTVNRPFVRRKIGGCAHRDPPRSTVDPLTPLASCGSQSTPDSPHPPPHPHRRSFGSLRSPVARPEPLGPGPPDLADRKVSGRSVPSPPERSYSVVWSRHSTRSPRSPSTTNRGALSRHPSAPHASAPTANRNSSASRSVPPASGRVALSDGLLRSGGENEHDDNAPTRRSLAAALNPPRGSSSRPASPGLPFKSLSSYSTLRTGIVFKVRITKQIVLACPVCQRLPVLRFHRNVVLYIIILFQYQPPKKTHTATVGRFPHTRRLELPCPARIDPTLAFSSSFPQRGTPNQRYVRFSRTPRGA